MVPTIVVAAPTAGTLRAPKDIGTDLAARHRFLQELAEDPEYIALLECVSEQVRATFVGCLAIAILRPLVANCSHNSSSASACVLGNMGPQVPARPDLGAH